MKYDIAVIGGGPAGMMAAGRAAELGARVVLIEKNNRLGVKLLITGKGRCNITNAEFDNKKLVEKFGRQGKFLHSAFHHFGPQDIIDFFNERGVKTKVERGQRVFPVSDSSLDVQRALESYLRDYQVVVVRNLTVKKIIIEDSPLTKGGYRGVAGAISRIEKIKFSKGEVTADKYIIATGGMAYPATGSSGDGYGWAKKSSHTIVSPSPALVPINVKSEIVAELEGLSLKNVNISVYQDQKKKLDRFGEAIFTAHGLSGPIILDMSYEVGELLKKGKVELQIDFKPALDFIALDKRVQSDFAKNSNRLFRNSLDELLPQKLIPVIVKLSNINPNQKVNSVTKEERKVLLHLLKEFKLEVKSLAGFDRAIVTAGGVDLSEIDPRTMKSKKIDNLYFAGEIIDVDGPTGGYSLQVCWSTGYLAGQSAATVGKNDKMVK